MAPVPIFRGRVTTDAHLVLDEAQRERRRAWLRTLAGSPVECVIRRPPRQRTLDQNKYIHAVPVALVADYTGETIEATKRHLMAECFGWYRPVATGLVTPWLAHTASMTVDEASYFIEWVPPFALERLGGLDIPLPDEVDIQ